MNIGIAGTGRMGTAIAQRLIECGHTVFVWNRTPEKTKLAQDKGARVAPTAQALATASDVIITILTNAAAIDAVYRASDGLMAAGLKDKLFIEMSTVRPDTERALARSLKEQGALVIECPVGGTTGPAREGKLLGLVGSDSEVAFERAKPLLEQLCRRIEWCGPIGSGATMKLAINLPLIVFWEAFGEAMAIAQPLGIDSARLVELFTETAGGANVLKTRAALVAKALSGEDTGAATFDLDSMRKDLRTMLEEARAQRFELPAATAVLTALDAAASKGQGGIDGVRIPAYVVQRSRGSHS